MRPGQQGRAGGDAGKSRWAAPGPEEGSRSPTSSTPPLWAHLHNREPLGPQSPATWASTPSLPRAGVVPSEAHLPARGHPAPAKTLRRPRVPSLDRYPSGREGLRGAGSSTLRPASHFHRHYRPRWPLPRRCPLPPWAPVWTEGFGLNVVQARPDLPPFLEMHVSPAALQTQEPGLGHPLPWELSQERWGRGG